MIGISKKAMVEEDIPPSLVTKPRLTTFQKEYWRAYQETSGSRRFTSGGPAEIPYTEKVAWLNENGIDDAEERNDFIVVITALDQFYLNGVYDK